MLSGIIKAGAGHLKWKYIYKPMLELGFDCVKEVKRAVKAKRRKVKKYKTK